MESDTKISALRLPASCDYLNASKLANCALTSASGGRDGFIAQAVVAMSPADCPVLQVAGVRGRSNVQSITGKTRRQRHFSTQPVNSGVNSPCGWAFELVLQLLLSVRATLSFWVGATAALSDECYNAPLVCVLQLMMLCYPGILNDSS